MSDDEVVHNVFEKQDVYSEVPVTIKQGDETLTIGQATVSKSGEMVHIEIDVKNDAPDEVVEFLKGGITGYSIAEDGGLSGINVDSMVPDHEITYDEAMALFEIEPHEHKPVQHRDGKPPWCDICKLTTGFTEPRSFFGKPANPIHLTGKARNI